MPDTSADHELDEYHDRRDQRGCDQHGRHDEDAEHLASAVRPEHVPADARERQVPDAAEPGLAERHQHGRQCHALLASPAAKDAAQQQAKAEEYYELYKLFADTMDQVERNYVKDASKVRAAVLAVHGLSDWNVKVKHVAQWYDALRRHGVEHKIWLHQSGHTDPDTLRPVEDVEELCSNLAIIDRGEILLAGAPARVIAEVRGRIWRRSVTREELPALEEQHAVISTKLLAGQTIAHVYAEEPPGSGFEPVEPDLKDVYFAVMGGHSGARAAAA